jgi:hypothetical protein
MPLLYSRLTQKKVKFPHAFNYGYELKKMPVVCQLVDGISARLAMLVVHSIDGKKEKTYNIKKASMKIGRSSTNEIVIDDSR